MKIDKCSVANGPGVRVVLWVSGCSIHCEGCHNPEAQDFNNGKPFTDDTLEELFYLLDKPYIDGLTLSGGHPLEDKNLWDIYKIVTYVKGKFPQKTIWLYTGYQWEQLKKQYELYRGSDIKRLLPFDVVKLCDVLVDGPYIDELRDITLPFRGSSNQRLIDVQQSLEQNKIIIWQNN